MVAGWWGGVRLIAAPATASRTVSAGLAGMHRSGRVRAAAHPGDTGFGTTVAAPPYPTGWPNPRSKFLCAYQVRLSIVEGGRVMDLETAHLGVCMVGLPAFLTSHAREHGALHGLLAVSIAVVFGFLVGVEFRRM
jgi:hypothetical protein